MTPRPNPLDHWKQLSLPTDPRLSASLAWDPTGVGIIGISK